MNKQQIRIFYRSRGRSYFKTPGGWAEFLIVKNSIIFDAYKVEKLKL